MFTHIGRSNRWIKSFLYFVFIISGTRFPSITALLSSQNMHNKSTHETLVRTSTNILTAQSHSSSTKVNSESAILESVLITNTHSTVSVTSDKITSTFSFTPYTITYSTIKLVTDLSSPGTIKSRYSSMICPSVITPICSNLTSFVTVVASSIISTPILSSPPSFSSIYSASSRKHESRSQMLLSTNTYPVITSSPNKTMSITKSSKIITMSSIIVSPSRSSSSIYPASSYIPIIPPVDPCDIIIKEFSNAMTNFTHCVLLNFHPMKVCKNCFNEYRNMKLQHRNISNNCYDILITDYNIQYQIIPRMFEEQLQYWETLGCKKCYNDDSNGKLSSDFVEFLKLHKDTIQCFNNYSHIINKTSHSNTTMNSVCQQCDILYGKIQKKYTYYKEDAGEDAGTNWCADINAAVNVTRHLWTSAYHCGQVERDLEAIIALTCFFCFLPFVFYIGAKLHSDVKERKSARRHNSDSD